VLAPDAGTNISARMRPDFIIAPQNTCPDIRYFAGGFIFFCNERWIPDQD
jgi:hypothetical protein